MLMHGKCVGPARLYAYDCIAAFRSTSWRAVSCIQSKTAVIHTYIKITILTNTGTQAGWLGSRVVSVLDSGAEGPGFKSQSRRCRANILRQTVHTHCASVHQAAKLV